MKTSAPKLHSHILPTATDGRTGPILGVCEIDPENRGYTKILGSICDGHIVVHITTYSELDYVTIDSSLCDRVFVIPIVHSQLPPSR